MREVTLEQAVVLFLGDFQKRTDSKTSLQNYRRVLRQFQAHASVRLYREIIPYHVTSYVEANKSSRMHCESIIRSFLRWSNQRFREHVFVPPVRVRSTYKYLELHSGTKAARYLLDAQAAAEKLKFPHQRAIFLCGFWHGKSLDWARRATLHDLLNLPKRAEFTQLLVEVQKFRGSESREGFFAPWLGGVVRTAGGNWHKWTEVPFNTVVLAGNVERIRRGIRLESGRKNLTWIYESAPPMDDEKIGQMPMPFRL